MPIPPAKMKRRPFQEAAATAIDRHAEAIQQTREVLAEVSARVEAVQAQIVNLRDDMTALAKDHAERKATYGSFLGRLRWVCLGR